MEHYICDYFGENYKLINKPGGKNYPQKDKKAGFFKKI